MFLPKYYIWHAKNKVRVYERLQELGYLSADWDEKQREIYRKIALHKRMALLNSKRISVRRGRRQSLY